MLRKAVLISCTLLLSVSLAVFSEQSGEQKPKDIEQQFREAMCLRNTGIAISSVGITLALVGGYFFMNPCWVFPVLPTLIQVHLFAYG